MAKTVPQELASGMSLFHLFIKYMLLTDLGLVVAAVTALLPVGLLLVGLDEVTPSSGGVLLALYILALLMFFALACVGFYAVLNENFKLTAALSLVLLVMSISSAIIFSSGQYVSLVVIICLYLTLLSVVFAFLLKSHESDGIVRVAASSNATGN